RGSGGAAGRGHYGSLSPKRCCECCPHELAHSPGSFFLRRNAPSQRELWSVCMDTRRNLRMKRVGWVGIGLLTVGTWMASPAWGSDTPDPLERSAANVSAAATTSTGSQQVAARMARELNTTCKCTTYTAATLTAQRTQNNWGWGEVLIANNLAQALSTK